MVELSEAQDAEAGDGTTSVVILAGSLLGAAEKLLDLGIHPSAISDAFKTASAYASEILQSTLAIPISLTDTATLVSIAATSLSSKVVAPYAGQVASIAVDAVMQCAANNNVDLRDIRIIKRPGGTIEDMRILDGIALMQAANRSANGPTRIEKARIGICQFQLSGPKTDMDSQLVVSDYAQMDRALKEERNYLLNMCKRIKKTGANVLLIQKSILRDAVNELSLHYLAKLKIMVVTEVERDEIDFLCRSLGCRPIADIDAFTEDKLGTADLIEEQDVDGAQVVLVSGVRTVPKKTVSILCRGASQLVVDEAERSLHDALCVVRCLVKRPAMICGGGVPEIELSVRLAAKAKEHTGSAARCLESYAAAMECIPTILAENAGLSAIRILTDLRARHVSGDLCAGINVRRAEVGDMRAEAVVQPLLVSLSAIQLATETVTMILKIDDMIQSR